MENSVSNWKRQAYPAYPAYLCVCVLFGNGQLDAADPKKSMNETGVFERICELFPKDEMVVRSFFHSIFREHQEIKRWTTNLRKYHLKPRENLFGPNLTLNLMH